MTSRRQETHTRPSIHSPEVGAAYERLLAGSSVRRCYVEVGASHQIHLLERGSGSPVLLLHGPAGAGGFFLPLLNELEGARAIAPDRPGRGLSDPIDLPPGRFRETTVAWVDELLDALALDTATLVGHSGGAMVALWYALAHPSRVHRLVLIGPPGVPKTRLPLPIRLGSTPGLGTLLSRLVPPSRKSVLRFARHAAGEGATLAAHPDLVDMMVAGGRDPIAEPIDRAELRLFVSPFALLMRSGLRRSARAGADELSQVAVPTLMIWGDHEPLGGVSVARAATALIPNARLVVLPAGHAPWLGLPKQTAQAVLDFLR